MNSQRRQNGSPAVRHSGHRPARAAAAMACATDRHGRQTLEGSSGGGQTAAAAHDLRRGPLPQPGASATQPHRHPFLLGGPICKPAAALLQWRGPGSGSLSMPTSAERVAEAREHPQAALRGAHRCRPATTGRPGASLVHRTMAAIRPPPSPPESRFEVLTPDFLGRPSRRSGSVAAQQRAWRSPARPETRSASTTTSRRLQRLQGQVRRWCHYSPFPWDCWRPAAAGPASQPNQRLMLGWAKRLEEVIEALADLRAWAHASASPIGHVSWLRLSSLVEP